MPRWSWLMLLLLGAVGCGVGIDRAVATGQEVASVALSVPILLIAGATLWFTAPKSAALKIDRLHEADLDDLIFYIYPKPAQPGDQGIPGDYLLQLHVAVYNLGDRKAVLSAIKIEGFRNDIGDVVDLPEASEAISGMQWIQRSGWINTNRWFENMTTVPPYILEPDDVIVIRFRTRRGIDWSHRWTLDALRAFCSPLRRPLVAAFGTMTWRHGGKIVREPFDVPLRVVQQEEYVQIVESLTNGFTTRPNVPEQTIIIE